MPLTAWSHHRSENSDFGLWVNQPVFREFRLETEAGIETDLKEETIKKLEEEVDKQKEKVEESRETLLASQKAYNQKYADEDFEEWDDVAKKRRPHEQAVKLDFDDLGATKDRTKAIQESEFFYEDDETGKKWHPFKEVKKYFEKRRNQPKELASLVKAIEEHEALLKKLEKAKTDVIYRRHQRLTYKGEKVGEIMRKRKEFKESREFNNAVAAFERAVESPLLSDRFFESFWKGPEGIESEQKLRESKQLFLSILAYETNDFAPNSFVLGENFKNDPAENKRNFPFLHHEWLTYWGGKDPEQDIRHFHEKLTEQETLARAKSDAIPARIDEIIQTSGATGIENRAAKVRMTPPLSRAFGEIGGAIGDIQLDFEIKIKNLKKEKETHLNIAIYQEKIKDLEKCKKLADAAQDYHKRVEDKEKAGQAFTRESLSKPNNRQILMELAMRKFKKAMETVDHLYGEHGGYFGKDLHPAIRRMLVATIYREGVSRYRINKEGKEEYEGDITDEYKWMFETLAQSEYFNRTVEGRFLQAPQRTFLLFARYANLAMVKARLLEDNIGRMEEISELIKEKSEDKEIDPMIAELSQYVYGPDGNPLSRDNIGKVIKRDKKTLQQWQGLYKEAHKLARVKNPTRKQFADYIETFKKTKSLYDEIYGVNNREFIKSFEEDLAHIDVTYSTLDYDPESRWDYLERLGMRMEYVQGRYEDYISPENKEGDPGMKIEAWDHMLASEEGVQKLVKMFNYILPETKPGVAQGKEDFLKVLETIKGAELDPDPKIRNAQITARNIVKMIEIEIRHREKIDAARAEGKAELAAKLDGMTFGDKITDYAKGVIDMVIGPGQSIANRAAGVALLIGAWKLAKKAYKGEGKSGKFLRVLFMAGAAELTIKHVTGEGLLDRFKLTGIAESMEGTYESVLLEQGAADMEKNEISDDEHARALQELNDVPFAELMEWYEATTPDGRPRPGHEDVKLPRRIQAYNIVRGIKFKEYDPEMRAAKVVKRTIENFFGYVGDKVEKDAYWGKEALNERWVKAITDKDYDLEKAQFTEIQQIIIKKFRNNPDDLTWEVVLKAEMDSYEAERVQKESLLERSKEWGKETSNKLIAKFRYDIYSPVTEAGKDFYDNLGTHYVPWVKRVLSELVDSTTTNVKIMGRRAEIWYEAKKPVILEFVDDVWQLTVEGVTLPLEVLYGVSKFAIPWTTTKLRQVKELLRSDQLVTIHRDLELRDVVGRELLDQNSQLDRQKLEDDDELRGSETFSFLGYYTRPFASAFGAANGNPEAIANGNAYFTETQNERSPDYRIGYLLTSVDKEKAGVKDTHSVGEAHNLMEKAMREQAMEQFVSKHPNLTKADLKKYMDTIHVVVKTGGPGEKAPSKIYAFYRMPMPDSHEYYLKEKGRFPDYYNAAEIKDRLPFIIDPKKGLYENVKEAFGLNSYGTKKFGGYALLAFSQWVRASSYVIGKAGGFAHDVLDVLPFIDSGSIAWIRRYTSLSEEQKQWLDEYFESARSPGTAMSQFYKNRTNAETYDKSLKLFEKNKLEGDLYLGHIRGRQNTDNYNVRPDGWDNEWQKANRP